jgi:hypothetical protein
VAEAAVNFVQLKLPLAIRVGVEAAIARSYLSKLEVLIYADL